MLERIEGLPESILGVTAKGTVGKADYQWVFWPVVRQARREGLHLRLLYELGREFEGFSPAAVLEDARVGLQSMPVLDRVAVVSDSGVVRKVSRVVSSLFPRPVKIFDAAGRDDAVRWLCRPPRGHGLSHRLLPEVGVVLIRIHGRLSSEDFESLAENVDHYLRSQPMLAGIVVEASTAPSWENLGSFLRHMGFVRGHHRRVRRVALVAEGLLARIAPLVARRLLSAEVRWFAPDERRLALYWAGTRPEDATATVVEPVGEPSPKRPDPVHEAGLESFPASDPPSH